VEEKYDRKFRKQLANILDKINEIKM